MAGFDDVVTDCNGGVGWRHRSDGVVTGFDGVMTGCGGMDWRPGRL